MDSQPFLTQYLPPMLVAVILALAVLLALGWLASRGIGAGFWRAIVRYRGPLTFLFAVVLFAVAFMTFVVRSVGQQPQMDLREFASPANLMYGAGFTRVPLTGTVYTAGTPLSSTPPVGEDWTAEVPAGNALAGPVFAVKPGEVYGYTFTAVGEGEGGRLQARLLWYDRGLNVLSWDDSAVWPAGDSEIHSGNQKSPEHAAFVRLELRNATDAGLTSRVRVSRPEFGMYVAYVEPHPNGAMASIAFSFDWETAMGGAVHSKGNETHDPAAAASHGMAMREGADWLAELFRRYGIRATFYATGYNLLDGNTERLTFNGDPVYEWASPDNEWASDYWLTHRWFSDDPFGTSTTDPAWYFGDQTRRLQKDGHEIAPHTFAHIYVRGSNPGEMATDLDTWIAAADAAGLPGPSTFAFPWRSSNSLTKEFYDVMYERGIRAVTRIYPLDMKDLYVLGSPVVYTDVRHPQIYPDMSVMPDFLLGAPATGVGEEAGGAPVGLEEGLAVLREAISRRGTTSFWTHPEQLSGDPSLAGERASWDGVVRAAAEERDRGSLWVDTVEAITAYQRDVASVTVAVGTTGSFPEVLHVHNASGRVLNGVTLSFSLKALAIRASGVEVRPVYRTNCETQQCRVTVSEPRSGPLDTPTYQVVLDELKPGLTDIEVEWDLPPKPQQ